jgi:hypothetical protein
MLHLQFAISPKQQTQVMWKLQNKRYNVMQLQNNKEKEIVDYKCDVMPELQNNKRNVMLQRNNNKNLKEIANC